MGVIVSRVVKFIRKGVGIAYIDVEYADSTSNSVAPTSGWQTTAPAWQNGHYIWTRTHIIYTDGTDQYSNPVCVPSGKGIASIVEQYYQSTSATELVGGQWVDNTAPTWVSGKYIWTRSKITYTDGTVQYTDAINPTGQKGDTGNGISSIVEYYLAHASDTGVTTSTSGWTTAVQALTATKRYLWNYEKITYTDGTVVNSTPHVIGTYGKGIKSVTDYYLATSANNGVTTSTSGWTTTVQTMTATNKYLWNYEVITYDDDTTKTIAPHIIGAYGDKGDTGNGISSIVEYYLAHASDTGVTTSTSGWTTAVQALTATKRYLWNYEKITYTDGTVVNSTPHVIGTYGKGIKSVTDYYLATSANNGVTTSTSGWTTTVQTMTATNKYLWNYEVITYDDDTTKTIAPHIIGAYGDVGPEGPQGPQGPEGGTGSQGPRGYRGPALRGPQDWEQMDTGYQFYKGNEDTQEPFEDFVILDGDYYKCIQSHTKALSHMTTNAAGKKLLSSTYWQLSDRLGLVAANVLFAKHGYFGSAVISGDWMISTNGTINGTEYNNGAKYNGIIAYSLFNPNRPLGGDISKYGYSGTYNFATSDATKGFDTVTLESGKVYFLEATGKANTSSGSYYVRLRNTSTGATYTPVMINGTSSVTRSGLFNCTASGTYYIEIYNNGGISGTVTAVKLVERTFAPVYALDLLTGAVYQGNAYIKGTIQTDLCYTKTRTITSASSRSYYINPQTEPADTFFINEPTNSRWVYLPDAVTYDGMEIQVFTKVTNWNTDKMTRIACAVSGQGLYLKVSISTVKDTGNNNIPVQKLTTEFINFADDSAFMCPNEIHRFKAMNGAWWGLEGNYTGE